MLSETTNGSPCGTKSRKAGKRLILAVLVIAISLFFLPEVYCFQFGLGTKGFVKKTIEKGQAEGKIAKTEEEKIQHDENGGGGGEVNQVASITVSPSSATLDIGATVYFTATAKDKNNNVLNVVFSWTTSVVSLTLLYFWTFCSKCVQQWQSRQKHGDSDYDFQYIF